MIFQYINVCPVPREMLKTSAYGLGFQHLPRDLANVNAWKTMFDPYIIKENYYQSENLYELQTPLIKVAKYSHPYSTHSAGI